MSDLGWYDEIKARHTGNGHDPADPARPPLRITDPTRFQDQPIPPRRWSVADWIPWGFVTGLYGPSGTGKTLSVQQLMTAAATKNHWVGLQTTPVRSLAVFCEDDDDELHRRQADINQFYNVDFCDLDDMRWLARLGEDNILMHFDSRGVAELTPFYGELLSSALDHRAKLVIVDTVADTFGGNHNDPGQARQFVQQALGGLARKIEGTVVACAHPSRAGQRSGEGDGYSVQWDATFRSRAYLSRPKDNDDSADRDTRVLSRKSANYASRDETIELRWKNGVLVRTDQPGIIGGIMQRSCQHVFLDLLEKVTDQGRYVSDSSNTRRYAPALFVQQQEEAEVGQRRYTRRDFERAMERLFADGAIALRQAGRTGHQHAEIIRASGAVYP
jgi:RecA-family ATPase